MRKKSIIISALLVTMVLLVGFTAVSAKVTLKYGLWDKKQVPAMEEIIERFEEENPNIEVKVELTPWGQYWTKLQVAATGGALPDVFWMNGPNFPLYASNGILMPIVELVEQDGINLDNYVQSLLNLYTYQGKLFGFPKDFDTIGLYYNKELFDQAGVEYPDESWDWDKVIDAAKKITDPEKGVWGIAAPPYGQENFYNTIFQNGGFVVGTENSKKISGYDKPETIGGLKFWVDIIHEYKVSPTLAQMTDTTARDLFVSGKVAMLYSGSWDAIAFSSNEYTKDKVDVAVLPQGKERAVVIHGLGNVISSRTAHPEEAWKFLKFLGSKEAANIQASTGTVIPAFEGTQQTWVASTPGMNLNAFIEMLPYSVAYPGSEKTAKWNELERKYFNQAWAGEISVEEAAKAVAKGMNEILATE